MSEEWRPIPGWEGYYEVSDRGRVKSVPRTVPNRPGVTMTLRERVLTAGINSSGYSVVWLFRHNTRTERAVHRLVLAAFVGPCPEGMEACHNNGDKSNNTPNNLRWDTRSANTHDKVRHGSHPMARKTHCKRGHGFTPENTYQRRDGGRVCKTCTSERKRGYRRTARRERTAA